MTQPRDDVEPSPPTLESLFRTQRLPMVRLAHLITGSSAVAEEVVQEAFIRMQNNWHRADNPKAYLRTIVPTSARRNCAGATASGDSTNRPSRRRFNPKLTRPGPPSSGG